MDETGKRVAGGLVVPRKSGLVLRDTADNRDQNAQFCNRIGCNGRINYRKDAQIGSSEKPKSVKSSFHASSGKEIIGSSSRTCSVVSNSRKSFQESQRKRPSQLETDSLESSSVQDGSEVSELIPSPGNIQEGFQSELKDAESGEVRLVGVGSSSMTSNTRSRKMFQQKSGLSSQDNLLGPSVASPSRSPLHGARNSGNVSKYGLRNLRCNSISDVLPSGCSSSESKLCRRKDVVKKRNPEGESSSSSRGKLMAGPSPEEGRGSVSPNNIFLSDSRRARNWPSSRDIGVASVRTRRSINSNSRTRLSNQGHGNNVALNESPVVMPHMPHPEMSIGGNVPSTSNQLFGEASSSYSNSYNCPSTSCRNLPSMMPVGIGEPVTTHSSTNHDALRRYNMDGIAEVLFALERIEQDEELTYEQLLALETNLFLGGLGFYDQHRDMRLDIDNMSYEELLALEERMGTVSTALSEEALSKCLRRSIYQPATQVERKIGCKGDGDETKCSICQEDYAVGDEVGTLECEHGFHVVCVHQWLRLKNWCPICKASAASSPSSPPL